MSGGIPLAHREHAAMKPRAVESVAGATLQAPHRAMSAQRGIPPVGVYVASRK